MHKISVMKSGTLTVFEEVLRRVSRWSLVVQQNTNRMGKIAGICRNNYYIIFAIFTCLISGVVHRQA